MDEDLLLFIKAAISSVWALEILLFMREHSYRAWTRHELARELRSNASLAGEVLKTFEAAGLVNRVEGGEIYAPASQELDELSGRLALAYSERPVAVVNAIIQSRTNPVESFAEAFRLKGGST